MTIHHLLRAISLLLLVWQAVAYWPLLQQSRQQRAKQSKRRPHCSTISQSPTKRPPCPLCQAIEEQPSEVPPPKIEQKRGRPREVETYNHYCPHEECRYYGWVGLGNIRANGHPNGGRWRQLQCIVCNKYFLETHGTIFYRRRVAAETILLVLKSLAEGVGIRKAARIFGVDPNDVLVWLAQAAEHTEVVSRHLLHDLQVSQVQLDELYALMSQVGGDQQGNDETATHLRRRRPHLWVWAAIDPVTKLLLAVVVGDRSMATAQMLIHFVVQALAPGVVPFFASDQLAHYATALLTHFGYWVAVPRRFQRGAAPKPRWMPLPELLYAQVVKRRVKGRVVEVTSRVVYGSVEAVEAALAQLGWKINTAFIERLNRTIRQHVAALGRRVAGLAKTQEGLRQQAVLWWGYYNFCLPHTTLRVPLPQPLPTKGNGSPKKWQQHTPAMAAGVTDHVWMLEELLLFRVPSRGQKVTA
ncbi:MAG: hypothetical protein H8E47_01415 [Anaerolineales bacterium]|nr:hypothetical protein [Anaerolineales bacterium]